MEFRLIGARLVGSNTAASEIGMLREQGCAGDIPDVMIVRTQHMHASMFAPEASRDRSERKFEQT